MELLVSVTTGSLPSMVSPITLNSLPKTSGPTGTLIGPPVSDASIPLLSPSVEDNATHLTISSPICCATSATIVLSSISILIALSRSGRCSGSNLISITGPII